MQRTVVQKDTTIRLAELNGDLHLEPRATVQARDGEIRVLGEVSCDGDAVFKGNLTATRIAARQGKILVQGSARITGNVEIIEGSMEVSDNLRTGTISVDQILSVGKSFESEVVDVGGRLLVGGNTFARTVNAGELFECKGKAEVNRLAVAGSVIIEGDTKIQDMDVGGSINLAGGDVSGKVAVTGRLQSNRSLSFGAIDVGGSVALAGGNNGGDINVGGRIKVDGDLDFRTLEIGGRAEISGTCRGASAKVGGKLEVAEDLEVYDRLDVGQRISVGQRLQAKNLELAGSLDAKEAVIEDSAKIGGMITTQRGLKAARIQTASNWEVRGPLIGKLVDLSPNAEAEDIYAQELHMSDGARARNVHANRISIGNNCSITGVVEYSESIVQGKGVVIQSGSPRKVEQLPDFFQRKQSIE